MPGNDCGTLSPSEHNTSLTMRNRPGDGLTMRRSSICIWVVGSASAIGIACLAALVVGGGAALRAAEAAGQDAADSPSFEARILKLNVSGPFAIVPGPARLRGTNIPARFLIGAAFADPCQGPLHAYRIIGGSSWLNTARFDLDARVPESDLVWTPDVPQSNQLASADRACRRRSAPALLTALGEQLGLKFQASRGPARVEGLSS